MSLAPAVLPAPVRRGGARLRRGIALAAAAAARKPVERVSASGRGVAIIGGGAAAIQFARIGAHAFVGGMSGLENDLIPYGMALGNRAHLSGLNIVGLQRRGFSRNDIHDLRRAYRAMFAAEGTLLERVADVSDEFKGHPIVIEIVDFIRAGGKRSLCTPRDVGEV